MKADPELTQRALIVTDDPVSAAGLKQAINLVAGLRAKVVSGYGEAREMTSRYGAELFVAVIDCGDVAGPAGEIMDLMRARNIPMLVLTTDVSESTRALVLSTGIIDYVVKDAHSADNIITILKRLRENRHVKVLVVEPGDTLRFTLCALLHQQMFQVDDVADGEAALQLLQAESGHALVLIGATLPGMDGVQLTRSIRETYAKDVVTVIGITDANDPMASARFIKNGANDFIAKPFGDEEFFCRINHNIEIMRSINALKEANKVKDQFLGMAAHDLRSPINGINGLSEMLLGDLCGDLNKEQRELIEYIHSANLSMNALVSDLLDISVIQAGELHLEPELHDLGDLLARKVRLHSISAKQKDISISLIPEGIGPFPFDERRVAQVLDNLLTNAIKFSPVGEVVNVTMVEEDGFARVCVIDRGQGVPPDQLDVLFKRFQKTRVKPTGGEPSTGLGLSIVKKIVEAHHGEVWCESTYGHGASFCFQLPLKLDE